MITSPRSRLRAWALLGALLGTAGTTGTAWPATAHQAPAVCTSTRQPALATRLSQDIAAALKGRAGTVSVAVHDPARGLRCRLADTRAYDSASVVKVLIMHAVLSRAEELGRAPTRLETQRLKAMITRSDNTAATDLWTSLSKARLNRVLREAGAKDTVLGRGGYWGLTRTTARDQLALLAAVSRQDRALTLMSQVVRSQTWGVTAGAPRTVKVHHKNGWLSRATHAWRVHSVGIARRTGHGGTRADYRIALLSHDNPTLRHGVRTLEGVAVAVHRRLAGGPAVRGYTPSGGISEVPDGSAPRGEPVQPPPPSSPPATLPPAPTPPPPPTPPSPPAESWPGAAPGPDGPAATAPPSRTARTARAPRRAPHRPRSKRSG